MSECKITHVDFHAKVFSEDWGVTRIDVIQYSDNSWALKIGDYCFSSIVNGVMDDIIALSDAIQSMLEAYRAECAEEAAESGDFEVYGEDEPKWDEKQTDAWLNVEG